MHIAAIESNRDSMLKTNGRVELGCIQFEVQRAAGVFRINSSLKHAVAPMLKLILPLVTASIVSTEITNQLCVNGIRDIMKKLKLKLKLK